MSEEPKWASPPGAKAASALVQGDTYCNHRSYQSHSASCKTAEEKGKRGLKAWGRDAKAIKSGSHLGDSYTHKQMGKTLEWKNWRRAMQLNQYEIMTRMRSGMIETDTYWNGSNSRLRQCHCFGDAWKRKWPMKLSVWDRNFNYGRG